MFPATHGWKTHSTRVSCLPARKRPIDAGLRPADLDSRASHPEHANSNLVSHSRKRAARLVAIAIAASYKSQAGNAAAEKWAVRLVAVNRKPRATSQHSRKNEVSAKRG